MGGSCGKRGRDSARAGELSLADLKHTCRSEIRRVSKLAEKTAWLVIDGVARRQEMCDTAVRCLLMRVAVEEADREYMFCSIDVLRTHIERLSAFLELVP